jgi:hypothetical protein
MAYPQSAQPETVTTATSKADLARSLMSNFKARL